MLKFKNILLCLVFLLFAGLVSAQQKAEINVDLQTYDFGQIMESDGLASHSFAIKNTGSDPLVLTRVTASCGCTRPEWTKAPIRPGETGEIKISYNPKGRPGPFYKSVSVMSNAHNGRLTLYVKGSVRKAPSKAAIVYPYNIGDLHLETKSVSYNSIRPDETLTEKIPVKNDGSTPIEIHLGKLPHFLSADIPSKALQPGETGEIAVSFSTDKAKKMGRISAGIPIRIEGEGQKSVEGEIRVDANVIDNFSKWSAADKAKAASIQFSTTALDFGKLSDKGGSIIPFIGSGSKESANLTITNTGKSNLQIYSITSDNEHIDISGGKKELKPGASTSFKVTLHSKEIKTKLEGFIHVVCNDPNGPVRMIKVTADK